MLNVVLGVLDSEPSISVSVALVAAVVIVGKFWKPAVPFGVTPTEPTSMPRPVFRSIEFAVTVVCSDGLGIAIPAPPLRLILFRRTMLSCDGART